MVYWDNLYLLKKYFWFASDDAHNHSNDHCPNDACGAWIMVKSKNLDVNSIMNSIKQGLFYASRGPEIKNVKIEKDTIYVITSPVQSISFIGWYGEMFTALKKDSYSQVEYKMWWSSISE